MSSNKTYSRHILHARADNVKVENTNLPQGICGRVSGIALMYNMLDTFGTMFAPGCLTRTISEKVPARKVGLYAALDTGEHQHGIKSHVGVITNIIDSKDGAVINADLFDTAEGRSVKEYLDAVTSSGASTGLSIGFVPKNETVVMKDGEPVKVFTECNLMEVSITPMSSVPGTQVLSVRNDQDVMMSNIKAQMLGMNGADIVATLKQLLADVMTEEEQEEEEEEQEGETPADADDVNGNGGTIPSEFDLEPFDPEDVLNEARMDLMRTKAAAAGEPKSAPLTSPAAVQSVSPSKHEPAVSRDAQDILKTLIDKLGSDQATLALLKHVQETDRDNEKVLVPPREVGSVANPSYDPATTEGGRVTPPQKPTEVRPFAGYTDFADCVAQNADKEDAEAYCGYIKNYVEGAAKAAASKWAEMGKQRSAATMEDRLTFFRASFRSPLEERAEDKKKPTQSVNGVDHPAEDFLVVPDPEKSSTWKFPVFDKAHVQNAIAQLDKANLSGQQRKEVKAKLKKLAKKYDIEAPSLE